MGFTPWLHVAIERKTQDIGFRHSASPFGHAVLVVN